MYALTYFQTQMKMRQNNEISRKTFYSCFKIEMKNNECDRKFMSKKNKHKSCIRKKIFKNICASKDRK